MSRGRSLADWLRGNIEVWNRGDREAYVGDVPLDFEFHTSGVFPGLKPIYRGPDGAAELWDVMRAPWETFTVTLERVEDMGDRVVGLVHFTARGRDGIETGRDWAYVVTGRDGVPMRTDNFATWAAALEAAGLSE
jgi:ketosteroid isomerase-like protein